MRIKVIVRNNLEAKDVRVREGNVGVFRVLGVVRPGKTYTLVCNLDATYREYTLTVPPDSHLVLTPGDLLDFKELSVYERDGIVDWIRNPSTSVVVPTEGERKPPATSWWRAVIQKLNW